MKKTKTYKVTNVVWDYDGDEDVNLPSFNDKPYEVTIEPYSDEEGDIEEQIADKLSEFGGYCVQSFNYVSHTK